MFRFIHAADIHLDSPLKDYPQCHPGYFNIGLLHTALNGREGHEPYAPCSWGNHWRRGSTDGG